MQRWTFWTLLLSLTLFTSANAKKDLYQVISAHPHDLAELTPFIETVKKEGRLWLIHLKEKAPVSVMKHLRKTSSNEVRSFMLRNKSAEFSAVIKDQVARIESSNIKNDVEALTNYQSRAVGTADNKKVTSWLKQTFSEMDYRVTEQCYRPEACSIIAESAGDGSTDQIILIMAHFDSVGRDFAGADDNASGTAVLLEIARVLKDYDNKKTIRFFATNGEELGLLGAKHYAAHLKTIGEIQQISLGINMDMVGYNSNGIVELETDQRYEALSRKFAALAGTYTTLKTKITLGAWGSDHVPFIQAGVPTLLTIEDWSTKTPCYHQACDKPDTLNYTYAAEIGKLNLAAILEHDGN